MRLIIFIITLGLMGNVLATIKSSSIKHEACPLPSTLDYSASKGTWNVPKPWKLQETFGQAGSSPLVFEKAHVGQLLVKCYYAITPGSNIGIILTRTPVTQHYYQNPASNNWQAHSCAASTKKCFWRVYKLKQ